jgi:hypothetical protein
MIRATGLASKVMKFESIQYVVVSILKKKNHLDLKKSQIMLLLIVRVVIGPVNLTRLHKNNFHAS